MQNKIKLVTVGYIALIDRKSGAVSTKVYKHYKTAKNVLKMHIEKAKQVRKEQIIKAILKGATILNKLAEKLAKAKQNLKNFGYSFERYIIVLKLKKAYSKALYN